METIPNYSKINSAKLHCYWYTGVSGSNGDLYIYLNGTQVASGKTDDAGITTSSGSLSGSNFNSAGINAGKPNSKIQVKFKAYVTRRFWTDRFSIDYDYSNPTYIINYSVVNLTNNKNETLVPGSISESNFTKGVAFDITTSDKTVSMTATPATGYSFSHWSLDGSNQGTAKTLSLTLNDTKISGNATTKNYTANFTRNTYTLTTQINSTGFGKIQIDDLDASLGARKYQYYDKIKLTAVPSTGYHFVKWSDGVTTASRDVTIVSDATYQAIFAIDTFFLNNLVYPSDFGIIKVEGTQNSDGSYNYGTLIKLTAIPNSTRTFVKWQYNNNFNYNSSIQFYVQDYQNCICYFRKTYVTYDTLFSLPKWIENGITSGTISCSLANDDKILLTNISTNGITKNCLIIPVDPNQVYRFDFDISLSGYKVLLRYCNSINENDVKTTEEKTTNSFDFQPTTEFLSIAFQIIGAPGTAATVSNILLYPNEDKYAFMKDTLNPLYRSNDTQWAIPTPYRTGYRFLGWYNTQEEQGTEENKVFSPGANMNPNGIDFPTNEDWFLYSHWENTNKARFRIARTNANVVIPSKS